MDIEERLDELIWTQGQVNYWTIAYSALLNTTTGVDDNPLDKAHENLQGYTEQRDALRSEIAADWRAMVVVCKKAHWVYDNWADLSNSDIEDMADELQAILARIKGGE